MDETYLKAPIVEADHNFGSVALSGDWLAVGALKESGDAASTLDAPNNDAVEAGVVYVFRRAGRGDWRPTGYLKGDNTRSGDHFGYAVAMDGRTLAVGAPLHDGPEALPEANAHPEAGAVYLFEVDDDGLWSQTDYLLAEPSDTDDSFGLEVALDGDILVVGTWAEGQEEGAIYVFERGVRGDPDGRWRQTAYVKAPNADAGDWFGRAADVFDGPGDESDRIIVGAAYEDGDAASTLDRPNEGEERSGAAYLVERQDDTWRVSHYFKAVNAQADDRFGHGVAIHGETLVIGAYAEGSDEDGTPEAPNENSPGAGAAYVYDLIGDQWQRTAFLKAIGAPPRANFGSGIVLTERHLVVGATYERTSGAAYLFTCGEGRRWSHRTLLKPRNADKDDRWGDLDAMDGGIIALGSRYESGGADRAGAVTIFEMR